MGEKTNPTGQARHSRGFLGLGQQGNVRDFITDDALLHLVAQKWILPIAAGYLPPK